VDVAREIVDLVKKFPGIELKGAVLDGQLFEGEAGVEALSKFPTRDEAIAKDVAIILGPGAKLLASVKGPGSQLAGILKAIEEKLEKGETIAKV
jgi:large subunit ribosomal protein L10